MILSGAKGKSTNIGQIGGCVGQQDFLGGRILKNLNDRTLPYFFRNDDRAESRGFVQNCFIKGLNLPEFIFHTSLAREGLIDTTVKTASSGYIQRKLVKSAEDFIVKYDGTVRNAVERIQQFVYGDAGIDTVKQSSYNIKFMDLGNKDLKEKYLFSKDELKIVKNFNDKDNEQLFEEMKQMRDHLRQTQIKATVSYKVLNNSYMLPINLNRISNNIQNIKSENKENKENKESIEYNVKYILSQIDYILSNKNTILYSMSKSESDNVNSVKNKDE